MGRRLLGASVVTHRADDSLRALLPRRGVREWWRRGAIESNWVERGGEVEGSPSTTRRGAGSKNNNQLLRVFVDRG
jgi:hypothetical protein